MLKARGKGRSGYRATLVAGIMSGVVLGSVALTASAAEAPAVAVRYHDLDINTQTGAERLYERIVDAAMKVCPIPESWDLAKHTQMALCRNRAVARAVSSLHNSQLAAVYTARTHRSLESPV